MVQLTLEMPASDGVVIRHAVQGDGPKLILVHGGATDHRCFEPVMPMLSDFTLVPYDRRGHGASDDAAEYSLEREATDLRELVEHVAPDGAFVLAYSFGALVTLHALTEPVPIRAAVLYEPPMGEPGMLPGAAQVRDLLDQGLLDDALGTFVSTTFHLSDNAVAAMRRGPMWKVGVDSVMNLRRELPVLEETTVPARSMATEPPTRILTAQTGGNPAFHRIASRIEGALAHCDVVRVSGLPHFAMSTEPAAFAAAARQHFDRYRDTGRSTRSLP